MRSNKTNRGVAKFLHIPYYTSPEVIECSTYIPQKSTKELQQQSIHPTIQYMYMCGVHRYTIYFLYYNYFFCKLSNVYKSVKMTEINHRLYVVCCFLPAFAVTFKHYACIAVCSTIHFYSVEKRRKEYAFKPFFN